MNHVYPLNDIHEHKLDGADCWCNPTIDEEDQVIIHNAADEREMFETGMKNNQTEAMAASTVAQQGVSP